MGIVLNIHSIVRFGVLLAAFVGIVLTLIAVFQRRSPNQSDQTISSIFLALCDVQMLLGLLVILLGGLSNAIHPVVMFVAIIAAHGLQTLTRRASGMNAHWVRLALYVVPLIIIGIGLSALQR